jgi:hypothetical protein
MECGNLKHGIRFIFKHEMLSLRKHELQNRKCPMFEHETPTYNHSSFLFRRALFYSAGGILVISQLP